MGNILLVSSSSVHGSGYLDHCEDEIRSTLHRKEDVLFIPYARPSGRTHDEYTDIACDRFRKMGYVLNGIHELNDPREAVENAKSLFVGGGNTFVLLNGLYENDLIDTIRTKVNGGMPYIGTSAGSNVAGISIGTTNDMPIVYPPSFDALGLVLFNINPHYIDPDPESKHMGETRETRINEFHKFNDYPVVGLREGAMLRVTGNNAELRGAKGARVFRRGEEPAEFESGDSLGFLLG